MTQPGETFGIRIKEGDCQGYGGKNKTETIEFICCQHEYSGRTHNKEPNFAFFQYTPGDFRPAPETMAIAMRPAGAAAGPPVAWQFVTGAAEDRRSIPG